MKESTPVFTIGYGHRSLFDVTLLLKEHRIQFLIDVRSVPVSKSRPEFDQGNLERDIDEGKIRYVFMGDSLGGRPSDQSCYENGHVLYERVRTQGFFQEGMRRLLKAVAGKHRICLLCAEIKPESCHRSKLIGVALADQDIEVMHIDSDGRTVPQSAVIARLTTEQGQLFDQRFQSRRSYRAR